MGHLHTMSDKEFGRLEIVQKLINGNMTQAQASEHLALGVRQVQRLLRKYLEHGSTSLISCKRGKPSNHKLSPQIKELALAIIRQNYRDFGPTLAAEKLREKHNCKISVETLRKWLVEAGLWIPRAQRLKRAYQPRYRRERFGELIQIDGSLHPWFEGRAPKCTLLVYIDDATSQIMQLYFAPSEAMHTYFLATKEYIKKHGRPMAFYSDKFGVFRVNQKHAAEKGLITQFGRALQELDIQLICANTCQAKGRVERANKTLQDRLVKELRLHNISGIKDGNLFLEEFRQDFNARFAKPPLMPNNAHRNLPEYMNADEILCYKIVRIVSQNLTIQHNRTLYLIEDSPATRLLRKKYVTFVEYPDGNLQIFYKGKAIPFRKIYDRLQQIPQGKIITDNKRLAEVLEYVQKRQLEHPHKQRSGSFPRKRHLAC